VSAADESILIFLLVAAALAATFAALDTRQRALHDRISDLGMKMRVTYGNPASLDLSSESVAHSLFRWVSKRLPEPKADTPQGERVAQLLIQAGYSRSNAPRNFHLLRLASTLLATVLFLVGAIALKFGGIRPLLSMGFGAALGAWLPTYVLQRQARTRQRDIACQLSDMLDLLVVCVEAGLGLAEAIKVVGAEAENQGQAIGAELSQVSGELSAGASLGQALRGLAERTAVEEIKPLAATLIQSEQLGAQIAPALRSLSDSLRNMRRLRAEEAAQKTTVKILFPLVFFILPAMMSVIIGPAIIQIMHTLNK
jgi:tight adherence protein C